MTITTEELERLVAGATQGPWQVHGSHIYGPDPDRFIITNIWGGGPFNYNLNLIALAPDLARDNIRLQRQATTDASKIARLREEVAELLAGADADAFVMSNIVAENIWLREEISGMSEVGSWYKETDINAMQDTILKSAAEIAQLREALGNILDGYGLNAPMFERQPEDDEDDWIVTIARAALAPLEGETE